MILLFTTTNYYKMTTDTQTSILPTVLRSPDQVPRLLTRTTRLSLQLRPFRRVKTNATLPIAPSILSSQTS